MPPLNIPESLLAWLVPVVILAVVILPNAKPGVHTRRALEEMVSWM